MRRLKKLAWSAADQGVSSISNLLLSVLAAQRATLDEFGAFAIAFAIYQFGLGASRAFIGEPALITAGRRSIREQPSAAGIMGASFAIGAVGTLVNLVAAAFAGSHATIFVVFGLAFPILMLADSSRYFEFAADRPRSALGLDLCWLSVQGAIIASFAVFGIFNIYSVSISWVAGALALAVYFMAKRRATPTISEAKRWMSEHRQLSFRFFSEYLAISGVQQSVILFAFAYGGLAASGALRGAQVIVGPLSLVTMGIAMVALPALSRRSKDGQNAGLPRLSAAISFAALSMTAAYSVALMLLPEQLGQQLLGESWQAAALVLPLVLIQLALSNLSYGATAGLRAMEESALSLRLRLATSPLAVALIWIGASQASLSGALIGAIAGQAVQMFAWWTAYLVVSRREGGGEVEAVA